MFWKLFQVKWSPKKTSLTPIRIFGPQPNIIVQKFAQMLKICWNYNPYKGFCFWFIFKSHEKKQGFELGLLDLKRMLLQVVKQ